MQQPNRLSLVEPLESRVLLSAAVTAASARAQHRNQDPYIQVWVDGRQVRKDYVLNFGHLASSSTPATKQVTLISTQQAFKLGAPSTPSNYSVSSLDANAVATEQLTITFNPTTVGHDHGVVVIPVISGGGYVVAVNVSAVVLPPPAVGPTKIDMARLPSVVGGAHSKGMARVQMVNNGAYTIRGPVDMKLYASADTTFNAADDLMLGAAHSHLSIKSGQTGQINVRFKYPVPPVSGQYHIFAVASGDRVIDPAGSVYGSPIPQMIQRPEIQLAGVSTQTPTFPTHNPSRLTAAITNLGNVKASARIDLSLYSVPLDQPGDFNPAAATLLRQFSNLKYPIKPGRTIFRRLKIDRFIPADQRIYAEITRISLPRKLANINTSIVPDSFIVR